MLQFPRPAKIYTFVCVASALFQLPSVTLAQMEYPPETKAIPIPTIESLPLVDGPFKGTPESLKQFQSPKWFLDAKFGIWAHWGPQAVPGDGDWYAREMYRQNIKRGGHAANADHVQRYGHPSKFGYKDILPLWKAEKWEPARLMELYKAAGAHYFVAQAVHHDNFDNWDSKYHKWNSVNIGPHKDMVGVWQAEAKKQGLPFGETGRKLVAQLYNVSAQQHSGKSEAVYCAKKNYNKTDFIDGAGVQDLEGRMMADIQPFSWQTDASTAEWFWVPKAHYLSSTEIICGLTDIVSKNGNLLLNVTLLPDGSLAPEEAVFLREMADWMKVNGEALFGTRPWTIYGEGPTQFHSDGFSRNVKYTPQDVRFTRKGDDIYAIVMGVPTGQVVIRALGSASPLVTREPSAVTLVGSTEKLQWSRTADNLVITVPATLPCKSAVCFKISGLATVGNLAPETLQAFKDRMK